MTDFSDCHVIHATPRRVRVQVPDKRHNRPYFESLRDQLSQWEDVERVDVNPGTTSIVIYSSDSGKILEMLEETGLRILEAAAANKTEPGQGLQLTKLNQSVRQWTGGRINVARVSVFLVVGAGIAFKIARGNQVSAAAMLLLYGGRAAQRWWLSSKEGRENHDNETVDEGRLLPSPSGA